MIHRYWTGPTRPWFVDEFHDEWERTAPVTTWTDATLPSEWVEWLDSLTGAVRSDPYRHRANCVRYRLLAEHGGMWADCDLRPYHRLPDDLCDQAFVASWKGHPSPGVMGGPANDAFFVDLTDRLEAPTSDLDAPHASGGHHLARVLADHPEVVVQDSDVFYSADGGLTVLH